MKPILAILLIFAMSTMAFAAGEQLVILGTRWEDAGQRIECPTFDNLEADEIGLCKVVNLEQQVYIIGYYNELATPVEMMTTPTGAYRTAGRGAEWEVTDETEP